MTVPPCISRRMRFGRQEELNVAKSRAGCFVARLLPAACLVTRAGEAVTSTVLRQGEKGGDSLHAGEVSDAPSRAPAPSLWAGSPVSALVRSQDRLRGSNPEAAT